MEDLIIRPANTSEWESVMELVWKTFLKFEAEDYSVIGVRSFQDFITDQVLHKLFLKGEYQVFVAVYKRKIVGVISLRSCTHISLLFVDEEYHKKGIGTKLIHYLEHYMKTEMGEYKVTVNSSPYAVGFYHKYGFLDMDLEKESDGIRYTPMQHVF